MYYTLQSSGSSLHQIALAQNIFFFEKNQNWLVDLICSGQVEQCTPLSDSFFYIFAGNFQVLLSAFSSLE